MGAVGAGGGALRPMPRAPAATVGQPGPAHHRRCPNPQPCPCHPHSPPKRRPTRRATVPRPWPWPWRHVAAVPPPWVTPPGPAAGGRQTRTVRRPPWLRGGGRCGGRGGAQRWCGRARNREWQVSLRPASMPLPPHHNRSIMRSPAARPPAEGPNARMGAVLESRRGGAGLAVYDSNRATCGKRADGVGQGGWAAAGQPRTCPE